MCAIGVLKRFALDAPRTFLPDKFGILHVAGRPVNSRGKKAAPLKVNVLSEEDGKQHFVEQLKSLAGEVQRGDRTSDAIDIPLLDSRINGTGSFPFSSNCHKVAD